MQKLEPPEYSRKKNRIPTDPPVPMARREDALLPCWTGTALKGVDSMRGRVQSAIHAGP